jgi:hypothetical protein
VSPATAQSAFTDALVGAVAFYAPKLYCHFSNNINALVERLPHLQMNFANSILPAATFNFRPQVATFEHTDPCNIAYGLCDIHALGSFDPKAGGHLILFDIKVAIEFPSGSTVQIPSAVLWHGNAAVQPREMRLSFTQYFAGGLIRWVRYGFRSLADLRVQNPRLKQKLDEENGE